MSVRYPVAASAEEALKTPLGRAARAREAAALIGAGAEFARELTGPEFETREAAEAAYAGHIDTGAGAVAPEDRFCDLVETAAHASGKPPPRGGQAEPAFEAGRRWPSPRRSIRTVWRLSVGYWRPARASAETALPQARSARRTGAERLDPSALRALARQPLRPVKPQQPLDIGLFEVRPPEAPHIVMPDE
jgi:hypothetical protein